MYDDKSTKLILNFKEIDRDDISFVGGKGANLGEMYNAGFPVPPGFCVTAYAYKKFVDAAGINKDIREIINQMDVDNNDSLQSASRQIQTIILTEQVPDDIAAAVRRAYEMMYRNPYEIPSQAAALINASREPPFVAVRSSATAEDLPTASFAGQQATFLNVKGAENVVEHVKKCWASLFTARAIFYREKNNFDHFNVFIAVPVQKMVDADKAGVAFSIDPVSENPDYIVIEGAFGLGEVVVGGHVNPDHYLIDKSIWEIVDKKIMQKKVMMRRDPVGKNIMIPLEEPKSTSQVLRDDQIVSLARVVQRIEEHYGTPQDVEWAYEGEKMYIVQSRPITTLRKKEESSPEVSEEQAERGELILQGLPASHGVVTGKVEIISGLEELGKVQAGEILVTKMTNPEYVPAMKRAGAIVTDEGGMTSHAAIVSREMGIPCIVGTINATEKLKDGDIITVDATKGAVYQGEITIEEKEVKEEHEIPIEDIKTETKILMNLGVPEMIERYKDLPIDGIGLMRLEFIIADGIKEHPLKMISEGRSYEYVDKLAAEIIKVSSLMDERPVVVRFSDFKSNEYNNLAGGSEFEPNENNPMMGWRGVSRYVSEKFNPAFRLECKAIRKVRESNSNVWVMLPFVRNTLEVEQALKIMEEEGLVRSDNFKVWLMAEVPAMAMIPEEFAKLPIDGVSVGSNDMTQLVLGVDRDSELLSNMGYFDERDPAVLAAIARLTKVFRKAGKTVSLCGQAPSVYPEFAEFLVNAGMTSISVNPDAVEQVKRFVAKAENKRKYFDALLKA